jgi:hypothetical protein
MNTTEAQSWETLCDLARSLLDEQDRQRWSLGEIVNTVQSHYGERSVLKFCEQVKAKPKTCYQYAQVYRFYPLDAWKQYPLARYTQWRDAMYGLKDVPNAQETALRLIAHANDSNMRMRDFYKELKRIAGKSTGGESLIHGEMTVDEAIEALTHFDANKVVRIVVKELDQ